MTSLPRISVADSESAEHLCRQIQGHAGGTGVTARRVGDEIEIEFANTLPVQLLGAVGAASVWLARRLSALGTPRALEGPASEERFTPRTDS